MSEHSYEMASIQNVISRYKEYIATLPYQRTVTGFLLLGGHCYYQKNSLEIQLLNSDGTSEFLTNEKGEIQTYHHLKEDEEYKKMSYKKIPYLPKYYGLTADHYFLHPWFPDEEIKAFEIFRSLPGIQIGEVCEVQRWQKGWVPRVDAGLGVYSVEDCLKYPEFFKPIYANEELNPITKKSYEI